jgi:hypothetical protein
MIWTAFDWTEVFEGIGVSLLFIAIPVIWRQNVHAERARKQREEHHAEVMKEHAALKRAVAKK